METADPPASQATPRPRRRLRFSLRTLLIATPILAALFAWIGSEKLRHDKDQAAIRQIRLRFDTTWSRENGRWNVLPPSISDFGRGRLYLPKTRLLIKGQSVSHLDQLEVGDWEALGNLAALKDLKLSNLENRCEGETFSRLSQLERLQLVDSRCTPEDFRQMTELTRLERFEILDFTRRQILSIAESRIPPKPTQPYYLDPLEIAPGSWPQMKTLTLCSVRLSDRSLAAISQMHNLQSLWIAKSKFETRSLDQLADLPNLTEIILMPDNRWIGDEFVLGSNADEQTLAAWGRMKNLETLKISGVELQNFGGHGQNLSRRWTGLTELSLSLDTLSPQAIREILAMPQLESLSLGGSSCKIYSFDDLSLVDALRKKAGNEKSAVEAISEKFTTYVGNAPIIFSGEQFDDQAIFRIAEMPDLSILELRDTKVTDRGIARLENHPTLRSLRIENCPITNRSLASIARMPSLTFRHCKFKETDVDEELHQRLKWRESAGDETRNWLYRLGVHPAPPVQPQR